MGTNEPNRVLHIFRSKITSKMQLFVYSGDGTLEVEIFLDINITRQDMLCHTFTGYRNTICISSGRRSSRHCNEPDSNDTRGLYPKHKAMHEHMGKLHFVTRHMVFILFHFTRYSTCFTMFYLLRISGHNGCHEHILIENTQICSI